MMPESPKDLAALLAREVEKVCLELWPNGKREGHEWRVGDVYGSAGHSLACQLTGSKAGMWCDFACADHKGDLLDAWALRYGIDLGEAMREVRNFLGLLPPPQLKSTKTYKEAKRPPKSKSVQPESPVMVYLHQRGLTDATIKAFHILEQPNSFKEKLPNNPADIVFPYLVADAEAKNGLQIINNKYLALERITQADGTTKKETRFDAGCARILFGWHLIKPNARKILICEGELDACTWHQVGAAALSVPNGAAALEWVGDELENLARFDEIFLSFDNDKAGEQGVQGLIRELGIHRCRIVRLPYKDANECLQRGLTTTDFLDALRKSTYLRPEEFITFQEGIETLIEQRRKTAERGGIPEGLTLPWRKADQFFMAPGHLTVWTGYGGHGKTTLLSHVLAYAIHQPNSERACVASLEMTATDTMDRLVRQLTGGAILDEAALRLLGEEIQDRCVVYHHVGMSSVAKVLEIFLYARRRHRITQFVVDSLMMLGIGHDDYDRQIDAAQKLITFAREQSCHVHLVIHPKKPNDENRAPEMYDVKGSGGLVDMAHNVVVAWRNKKKHAAQQDELLNGVPMDANLATQPDTTISIQKNRLNGWNATIPLWFHPASQQFLERPNEFPVIYAQPGVTF